MGGSGRRGWRGRRYAAPVLSLLEMEVSGRKHAGSQWSKKERKERKRGRKGREEESEESQEDMEGME